jgi:hypothetical protein
MRRFAFLAPRPPGGSRLGRLVLGLGACLGAALLAGCGEGQGDVAPPPASDPVRPGQRWNVEPARPIDQARFALARLLSGPLPQEVLVVPDQRVQTAAGQARSGRAALETAELLGSRPCWRASGPGVSDLNPWHSLLEVLSTLPRPDAELVARWVEPALSRKEPALSLRALGCLAATGSDELGSLTLRFLEQGASDRILSRQALRILGRMQAPWPARGVALTYARGSPFAWLEAASALEAEFEAQRSPAATRASATFGSPSDLLAWWALLAEQAGPRAPGGMPRVKSLPYTEWRAAELANAGLRGLPRPPSAREVDERGWLATDPDAASEFPLLAVFATGQEPSAVARCALASRGHAPFQRAVEADRSHRDPIRQERATHCMLADERGVPTAQLIAETEAFLASRRRPEAAALDLEAVALALRRLPPADGPAATALLRRVLLEARPVADLLLLLEGAHDALAAAQGGADEASVLALLEAPEPEDRGLGMHLAQRSRKGLYLAPLLKLEAGASAEGRRALRRGLQWIASGGGLEPAVLQAYVRRFGAWLDGLPDGELAVWATGLLDLGEAGEEAMVERLRGPRGRLYVLALRDSAAILPLPVAETLCDALDASRPVEARHELLVTLWRSAPAQAASALAAAKGRLEPADRQAVDVVLEVVRHRAAR